MSDEEWFNKRDILLNDGINSTLVLSMSDEELAEACSYEDYEEYNEFMEYMARKYNI